MVTSQEMNRANAVYGLDWSQIVDHPAMLSNRFQLGRADAGR